MPASARGLVLVVALLLLVFASVTSWRVTATLHAVVRSLGFRPVAHAAAAVVWPFDDRRPIASGRRALFAFVVFLAAVGVYLAGGAMLLAAASQGG